MILRAQHMSHPPPHIMVMATEQHMLGVPGPMNVWQTVLWDITI